MKPPANCWHTLNQSEYKRIVCFCLCQKPVFQTQLRFGTVSFHTALKSNLSLTSYPLLEISCPDYRQCYEWRKPDYLSVTLHSCETNTILLLIVTVWAVDSVDILFENVPVIIAFSTVNNSLAKPGPGPGCQRLHPASTASIVRIYVRITVGKSVA